MANLLTINYSNTAIYSTSASGGVKLNTAGKRCEEDIEINVNFLDASEIGETLPDAAGVSFGGTYAFIRVTYPSGSTCTCAKGNTTLTAEDTSGSYTFVVEAPASGTDTWTVSCTNGSASVANSISISSAGILSIELDYAYIYVTYPSGSTCTCTKGNTTLTAPNTSGSYTFVVSVPSSGTDTWTVSCTNGSASVMNSISISSAGVFSTELDYAYISVTYPIGSTCTCAKGNTTLTAPNTSGSYTFVVSVPSSGTDTWTVSCTDGTDSSSDTVNITSSSRMQSVELTYTSLITFYISSNGYTLEQTAEPGMTWAEFVSSSYYSPPPSVYVTSDGKISNTRGWEPMTQYLMYQNSNVYSTDEIIADRIYSYGGGGPE